MSKFLTLIGFVAVLTACGQDQSSATMPAPSDDVDNVGEELREDANTALDTAKTVAGELQVEAQEVTEEMRVEAEEALEDVKKKLAEEAEKIKELKTKK